MPILAYFYFDICSFLGIKVKLNVLVINSQIGFQPTWKDLHHMCVGCGGICAGVPDWCVKGYKSHRINIMQS